MDVRVSFLGHSVSVQQSHRTGGEDNTGWRCWPASAVALRVLASPALALLLRGPRAAAGGARAPPAQPFSSLSLLDLSAGAGLVAAAASAAGARVTATETESALPLLAANAPRAATLSLYWGAELSAVAPHAPFDAVVACDLVFIALRDGRARELDRTLRRLATELAPVLLVYEERRIADEDAFVRALALPGGAAAPPLRCDEVEDPELVRLPKDERLVGLGGHDEGELEGLFYMPPPVRVVVLRAQ
jgi:hypothetical protein